MQWQSLRPVAGLDGSHRHYGANDCDRLARTPVFAGLPSYSAMKRIRVMISPGEPDAGSTDAGTAQRDCTLRPKLCEQLVGPCEPSS